MPATYAGLAEGARQRHLQLLGGFHPEDDPGAPEGTRTLILIGPGEQGFWLHVSASAEFGDERPDPLDRWSQRVVGQWADETGATALFPFGGPPYRPFIRWARESGRSHTSPVGLLAHDVAGLMVSFRGALALAEYVDLPPNPPSPCPACEQQPCRNACPAGALVSDAYDVSACHDFLDTPEGDDCMKLGCAVRRACPVSHGYGRMAEQSAYHMSLFHRPR